MNNKLNSEKSAETAADKSGADEVTTSSHSSANTTVGRSVSLEQQEKRADIKLKKLQALEKESQIKAWEVRKMADVEEKTKIDKINSLRMLLESFTIDTENTILSSEPKFKSVFDENEQKKIKQKMFQILSGL